MGTTADASRSVTKITKVGLPTKNGFLDRMFVTSNYGGPGRESRSDHILRAEYSMDSVLPGPYRRQPCRGPNALFLGYMVGAVEMFIGVSLLLGLWVRPASLL